MILSLRARLATWAGATAGILFACVFAGVVAQTNANITRGGEETLQSALRQASAEYASDPLHPDLPEITSSDPHLTIAAFDPAGRFVSCSGPLKMSTEARPGLSDVAGSFVLSARNSNASGTVVASLLWSQQRSEIQHLSLLLALLWGPLTACVALATWQGSKSTFSHLAAMAEKASRMGTDLSERLPVPADPDFGLFTIRLNELLGRVSSSALLQERFVADAAHELRTPLAIILGGIDSILQKPRQAEEYLHTLEQMQHETARLSSLVEMLLLTAESTKGEATVTDLSDSLEQAHARWVDQFVSKKVELELVVNDLLARIEPQEIQVVLDNLLANALKFSPSGSSCEIALEREAPYAKIIVSDEGPGVPSELSDQIFDRFVRNSSARSRDGFGIGLSICRRIIESRGGTISLDTAYSKGSRFVIRLQESYLQEF